MSSYAAIAQLLDRTLSFDPVAMQPGGNACDLAESIPVGHSLAPTYFCPSTRGCCIGPFLCVSFCILLPIICYYCGGSLGPCVAFTGSRHPTCVLPDLKTARRCAALFRCACWLSLYPAPFGGRSGQSIDRLSRTIVQQQQQPPNSLAKPQLGGAELSAQRKALCTLRSGQSIHSPSRGAWDVFDFGKPASAE